MDPSKWIIKYDEGGSQESSLEPYDQMVKERDVWVDLEPVLLVKRMVAK